MQRAATFIISLALLAATVFPSTAVAAAVSAEVFTPGEVVALGTEGDGRRISVQGEALGETIRDGAGGYWVNVLNEGVGIGLWSEDAAIFEKIDGYGEYDRRGTIVRARGTYNAACDQHAGDRDVHIESLEVVEDSQPIERPFKSWKWVAAVAMAGVAAVLYQRYRQRAEREF